MSKIMNKLGVFTLGILSILLFSPLQAKADEGLGFSVTPILPSTQIDKELGFFYIETAPNKEQTIEVRLNGGDEKKVIQMAVEDAYTAPNGILDYGIDGVGGFKQDETLKLPVSQLVKPVSEEITLEPNESKVVSFKVDAYKESYSGVKIGQMIFKAVEEEESKTNSPVKEEYQYAINIITSENGDDYNDGDLQQIKLNEVKPTIKYGKRLVTANLQNPQPKRIINLETMATITKKGSDKVVKQTKIPEFQFAPNTNVDFEVDWGLSEIEAGEYVLSLTAENDYDSIHLTKDFRITDTEAKKINKDSAFKIKTPTWVKIVTVVTGLLVVVSTIVILVRNKKWVKMSQRKNRKRHKKR
jgi:hypothetical protein